jgi:multiple sugar transport system permease protein
VPGNPIGVQPQLAGALERGAAGRRTLAGYLFLLPNFSGFLLFLLLPIVFSLVLSFCEWNLLTWPPRFIGLQNFSRLMADRHFWYYVFNTTFFMLGIPFGIIGSLMLAILLNQKLRLRNLYRTIFFLPTFTAGVALLMVWRWLLNTDYGLINKCLIAAGLNGVDWLNRPWSARFAFLLMGFWTGVGGYNMILYLAALQNVNPELYEAAAVDGTNWWDRFRHITWPLVSPTTFFIFIISIIGGFQSGFSAVYLLARDTNSQEAVTTIDYYIYENAYHFYQMGYASAISWFLFILVFVFTLINWRYAGSRIHYD